MDNLFETFEEACQLRGYDPVAVLPDVSKMPEDLGKAITATAKLYIIHEAANLITDGEEKKVWQPNWDDRNEYKHYPWFDMEVDGRNPSGFRLYDVRYVISSTCVGSRLCSRKEEIAEHLANKFLDLYLIVFKRS